MKHESNGDTNYNWSARNGPQRLGKGTGRAGNQKASRDHPIYGITKISQNTEKSPGDFRKIAVTQTQEKNYQLTLV